MIERIPSQRVEGEDKPCVASIDAAGERGPRGCVLLRPSSGPEQSLPAVLSAVLSVEGLAEVEGLAKESLTGPVARGW